MLKFDVVNAGEGWALKCEEYEDEPWDAAQHSLASEICAQDRSPRRLDGSLRRQEDAVALAKKINAVLAAFSVGVVDAAHRVYLETLSAITTNSVPAVPQGETS